MKFSSRFLIPLLLLSLLPFVAVGQRLTAQRGTVKNAYDYWFFIPGDKPQPGSVTVPVAPVDTLSIFDELIALLDSTSTDTPAPEETPTVATKPLVVFLHGASLCGRNLSRVRRYGTIDALSKGLKLDAYVVAPQNPGGAWNPDKINRIVDWALSKYAVDSTRIYVLGMSLGGYGTIDYAAHSPQRVAAAMALCGGASTKSLDKLNQVPLAILHGTGDRAVSWKMSQAVVDAMVATGDTSRLIYRLLPKQTHGALARYFYVPEVYEWLFQHSLADSARTVNRDYNFGIEVTNNAFRKLEKPAKPLQVDDAGGRAKGEVDESSSGVHVVRQGDTLGHIAKKHHTTVARLCQLNKISRTSTLRIGQKIRY